MSKHQIHTLPTLTFGTTRTGTLKCALGRRGRVGIKGDATFSRPELQALVSQLTWFLAQVPTATTGLREARQTTTSDPLLSVQCVLPLQMEDAAPSAADSVNGSTRTAITS